MSAPSLRFRAALGAIVFLACASGLATAAEVNLSAITFPENAAIDVPMARTLATPTKTSFEATVRSTGGQARVHVEFKKMEPAILFGGDVSSYVVWAVTRDGAVENLGELVVDEAQDKGSNEYATPKKSFALMITAEPYYLVGRPGELVVATSGSVPAKKADSSSFAFTQFRPLNAKVDTNSIANLTYKDKKPVVLVQAERAMLLAQSTGAAALNPTATAEAQTALSKAHEADKAGNRKGVADYSRRVVSLSAEAMRDWGRKMEADAAAKKKAEMDAMTARARASEMDVAELRAAQAKLLADQAALRKERDELEGRLKGSMASIMDTRESARGAVMSLPGISFEPGKAVLKPSAQLTLAKLAGIAQVFPQVNMRIEGYTDTTGNAKTNQALSEARAKSVYDFLKSQGVAETRLAFQGLGPASPVADNAKADGRAKNRRVEIVAAVGEIKPVTAN